MSNPWTPEYNVDAALVRRLLAEQFPGLAGAQVEPCGLGWDNIVFRVGRELYFRFPTRAPALEGVEREIEWLPRLERAGLPVPRLRHVGRPGAGYPFAFFGYEHVRGTEACDLSLSSAQRARLALPLARFLRALHSESLFESGAREKVPVDPIGRLDFARRGVMTRDRLATIKAAGRELKYDELDGILAAAERLPRLPATALVHGDLHFRHVILTGSSAFSGVIDWGDLHLNSPAVDLQLVFTMLPPESREEFWQEYGQSPNEHLRAIIRGFAVFLNVALLHYSICEKLPVIEAEATLALSWV